MGEVSLQEGKSFPRRRDSNPNRGPEACQSPFVRVARAGTMWPRVERREQRQGQLGPDHVDAEGHASEFGSVPGALSK